MDWQMNENILRRIDKKLDIVIGLLQDGILVGNEAALITETDELVRNGEYRKLVKMRNP
jgi:hypothetical protein